MSPASSHCTSCGRPAARPMAGVDECRLCSGTRTRIQECDCCRRDRVGVHSRLGRGELWLCDDCDAIIAKKMRVLERIGS